MLMRTDPFRELDRMAQQWFGTRGTPVHPTSLPLDAYRDGETFFLHFDVPGMEPGSLDLQVERNVLTISGQRKADAPDHCTWIAAERPSGSFSRQVFLGDALDTGRVAAHYDAGVLTVTIPIAEQSKPRRVEISGANAATQLTE
jgi:HSP20 family protein